MIYPFATIVATIHCCLSRANYYEKNLDRMKKVRGHKFGSTVPKWNAKGEISLIRCVKYSLFYMRIVGEQTIQFRTSLHVMFINFEKAFWEECINRSFMWKAMKTFRIHQNIANIRKTITKISPVLNMVLSRDTYGY